MPRKTEWTHRIPKALQALRDSPAPLVDRRDVEQLLEVSSRQALRILHQLGAVEAGRNLFLGREELIARLERLHAGEDLSYERRRLQRLDTVLGQAATRLRARQVAIPAGPEARDMRFPSLPSAVRLRPGRLEIEFGSPEELLTRLYELSQALVNDYPRLEDMMAAP